MSYCYFHQNIASPCHYAAAGEIASLPRCSDHHCQFLWRLHQRQNPLNQALLQCSWYGCHPKLRVGQRWYLQLRLHRCAKYQGHYHNTVYRLAHGILASGYVLTKAPHFLVAKPDGHSLLSLRARIQNCIVSAVAAKDLAAIVSALTIGSRALLTRDDWTVFARTGTSHLVAISGLHLGVVALLLSRIFMLLLGLVPGLALLCPIPLLSSVLVVLATTGYAFLSGFSLPSQRALLMLLLLLIPQWFYAHVPLWRRLALAFVVIVVIEPLSVLQAGLWLSFFAVFSILYHTKGYYQQRSSAWQWLSLQSRLSVSLLPISLWFFAKVSVVGLVANLIAIPWVSLVIVPLALINTMIFFCSTTLASLGFILIAKLIFPLWWLLRYLAHWSWSSLAYPIHSVMIFLCSILAVLLLLMPRGLPGRFFGFFLIAPLCFRVLS